MHFKLLVSIMSKEMICYSALMDQKLKLEKEEVQNTTT